MSDTVDTPDAQQTPAVEQQQEKAPKTYDQAYVDTLRQEAAGHRVGKKEAVEAAEAKVKADYEAVLAERDVAYTELQNQLGEAWIELEKYKTALELKVPSDRVASFVSFLQGTDAETIGQSAKAAFDLAGGFESKSPAFDPSQGFGQNKPIPLNGDPILAAIKSAVGVK
ncbi:scaffolding protein [Gordonia phage Anon]|nr:scaffolding protein [Gordonia phage Anon]